MKSHYFLLYLQIKAKKKKKEGTLYAILIVNTSRYDCHFR